MAVSQRVLEKHRSWVFPSQNGLISEHSQILLCRKVFLTFLVLSYAKTWKENSYVCIWIMCCHLWWLWKLHGNYNFPLLKANYIIELCSALTWDGVYCVRNKVKYLELWSFGTAILSRIVQIEKTDILLLQQVKVPIWAVEKQYYEMAELVGFQTVPL